MPEIVLAEARRKSAWQIIQKASIKDAFLFGNESSLFFLMPFIPTTFKTEVQIEFAVIYWISKFMVRTFSIENCVFNVYKKS